MPKRKRLCTWVMYSCNTQSDGVFPPTYYREQDLTSWVLACSPHGGDSQQAFAGQVTVRRGRVGLPPWFLETDLPLRSTVFPHGFFPFKTFYFSMVVFSLSSPWATNWTRINSNWFVSNFTSLISHASADFLTTRQCPQLGLRLGHLGWPRIVPAWTAEPCNPLGFPTF